MEKFGSGINIPDPHSATLINRQTQIEVYIQIFPNKFLVGIPKRVKETKQKTLEYKCGNEAAFSIFAIGEKYLLHFN
jgi:hypothetical protein